MQKTKNIEIFIYGLHCSDDETIRYVGKTNCLKKRLKNHVLNSNKKITYKDRWIQKEVNLGKEIKIKILEITTEENWKEREVYWINYYKENLPKNKKLTNTAIGGGGGCETKYTLSYEEIKDWVKINLKISSKKEWEKKYKDFNLPDFIPYSVREVYWNRGWKGWGDFLGTGRISDNCVDYISYDKAKKWLKENLTKINSSQEFKEFAKKNLIPKFIPNRPERYYKSKDRGWISWGDFLNTGNIQNQLKTFLNYEETKKYAIKNNIKTAKEWESHKNKPYNINSKPQRFFKNNGWKGWGDFLGTNRISNKDKKFLSFNEAKLYISKLNLNTYTEWKNLKNKPNFIPFNPDRTYKKDGWKNWSDFLGIK
jgi:hypothetical protein